MAPATVASYGRRAVPSPSCPNFPPEVTAMLRLVVRFDAVATPLKAPQTEPPKKTKPYTQPADMRPTG